MQNSIMALLFILKWNNIISVVYYIHVYSQLLTPAVVIVRDVIAFNIFFHTNVVVALFDIK